MNRIQGTKTARIKWNQILGAVFRILKYREITIDHAIYSKLLSDVTVYYLTVSTDDVIDANNNETAFPEQIIFFEEDFDIKFQERYVLKYLNFRVSSLLLVSVVIRMITSCT